MDSDLLHYTSGEEVHAGDRVQHSGGYATVVFVSDGESEEFSPGYGDYARGVGGVENIDGDGGRLACTIGPKQSVDFSG